MKLGFLKHYYQTILLIIEDRPKYEIPIFFYKALVFISYLQIFVYLLSDSEEKKINDYKLQAVVQIIQIVSLKNVLQIRDNETSSLVIYIIIYIFMYSYFIYVGILAFVKYKMVSYYEQSKKVFIGINQILNLYFALYIQIFFTQFVELNSSIMFCSENSLLDSQRIAKQSDSCSVPIWLSLLGCLGLVLTLTTAWIATYFFRNYEFMEYNLIKRKTSNLFSILTSLKFALTILFFANVSGHNYIKHILSHLVGLISLIDYFINHPYSDINISRFYLKVVSWYYSLVILTHIWNFSSKLTSNEYFYIGSILGLIVEGFFQGMSNYQYDYFLITEVKYDYIPPKLDFYLEEIIRLVTESAKDELSKIQLQKLMKSHYQTCMNPQCPCKEKGYKAIGQSNSIQQQKGLLQNLKQSLVSENQSEITRSIIVGKIKNRKREDRDEQIQKNNGELDYEYILSVVDSIFKFYLQQPKLNKEQAEYEHLSLKYITFMIKYLKNYTRANYELKILQIQREDFSLYFKMISKIISDKIQEVISQMNIHLEQRRKDELSVRQLISVDEITKKYIPIIVKVLNEKQKLWDGLQKGYRNMNQFQNDVLKLMHLIKVTKIQFFSQMNTLQIQQKVNQIYHYQKLYLIFYLFVLNDNINAYELECLVQDLRKRDSLKDIDTLSNENYLRENIINLTISISQNLGKIVSKKDEKAANFFGYSKQDFLKIQKINELMIPAYARIHDNIIKSFVNRGESKYIKSSKHVYAKDQNGFLMPVKLYLDYSFTVESDFQVNGTLLKINHSYDYIIFHRTGKVVGITNKISQFLLSNINQKGNKLPSGDYISNNLNIFLLFPKLASRIFKKRDVILNNIRSEQDILLQDRKGQIIVRNNPLLVIKKLQSYITKMNQSSTLQKKMGNQAFEQIDLFNQKSFDIINNYRRQDIENSSAAGLSSGRLSSGRSVTTKGSLQQRDQQKYRIRFIYTLSFSCASTSYNTEQNLYFQLKINDINVAKVKDKRRSNFKLNLVTYLFSTCLIGKFDYKYKSYNSRTPIDNIGKPQNEWDFTDQDIPTKLIKIVLSNESFIQVQDKDQLKKEKSLENELDGCQNKKKGYNSDSSDGEDDFDDYTEGEEEDIIFIDSLRNKKKILEQYEESAKFLELNQVLQEYNIQEEDILKIDPNFKVKKVIQNKTFSSAFGRALEKAVIETMLQSEIDNNIFQATQFDDYNLQEVATFRDFNINNQNNVIHPKQIQVSNTKEIKDSSLSMSKILRQNSSLEKQQSNILKQDLNVSAINVSFNQDINLTSNLNSQRNPLVNNDVNLDISSDNLRSFNNPKDKTKYFDASARPLFKQPDGLAIDNDILLTPSVDDLQRYLQSQNQPNTGVYFNTFTPLQKSQSNIMEQKTLDQSQSLQDKNKNSTKQSILFESKNKQNSNQNKPNVVENIYQQNQSSLNNDGKMYVDTNLQQSGFTKNNGEEMDDQSGKLHEKVVVQILNQKGLIRQESIHQGSIHSSSKSSNNYGGNFLKGIYLILILINLL